MSSTPTPPHPSVQGAHVVVVGAGGIGCPAAWALAEAGVGRLTLIDPDLVEPSNLPRQVLYVEDDVGRPKALVAAERLRNGGGPLGTHGSVVARPGARIEGHQGRLDHENEALFLVGADVIVDATDRARTKDWLNALAVRRSVPLVHAAGLRSEGRLLDVPAGGRPCLACLFGRLTEEQGTCADLGVWGGVVGVVGFLAAQAALRRLAEPAAVSTGYTVLDLEGGRAFALAAEPSGDCPVCGSDATRTPENYPAAEPCAVEEAVGAAVAPAAIHLDLVDESCPMNLLRARRAVEELSPGDVLEVRLGAEGAGSVPDGLRALGHEILSAVPIGAGLHLRVRRGRGPARGGAGHDGRPLGRDELIRYARQIVLPEVGEDGQRRLLEGKVIVRGAGAIARTAAVYLAAAGVGEVAGDEGRDPARDPGAPGDGGVEVGTEGGPVALAIASVAPGRFAVVRADPSAPASGVPFPENRVPADPAGAATPAEGPVARALGALLADAAARLLVLGGRERPSAVVLGRDGTIAPPVSPPR